MEAVEYQKMYEFENGYWWYRGLHELVTAYVGQAPGGLERRIFDAGCGTGRLLERLAPLGRVEGVDYSPQAIDLCRSRGLNRVAVADLNTWVGEPNSLDALVSCDVLCTEGIVDDTRVMAAFYEALRPGGIFIFNVPAFPILKRRHDIAVSTLRRYRKGAGVRQLEGLGFEILRAGYRLPVLAGWLLIQKCFESRDLSAVASDLRPLPTWLNALMLRGNRIGNWMFRNRLSLPFGSSFFVVCRKPDSKP